MTESVDPDRIDATRRALIAGAAISASALAVSAEAHAQATGAAANAAALRADYPFADEPQQGDPQMIAETIRIDPLAIMRTSSPTRATFQPRIMNFGQRLLTTAQRYLNYSRTSNPTDIERMLRLYDFGLRDASGTYIPYCAAGVSWCAAAAYREEQGGELTTSTAKPLLADIDYHHFYPSPSVRDMYHVALGKRRWRAANTTPRPGWLVVYQFGRPANHVGIVERATATELTTIEFNTTQPTGAGDQRNGGVIARRTRPRNTSVMGFIATDLRSPFTTV